MVLQVACTEDTACRRGSNLLIYIYLSLGCFNSQLSLLLATIWVSKWLKTDTYDIETETNTTPITKPSITTKMH